MWGRNKSGTRRFRCLICKQSFTWNQSINRSLNRFSLFEKWLKGISINQLASFSRKSPITIRRAIHWYLKHPPKPNPTPNPKCNFVLDATWFGRKNCLLVYWDTELKKAQWWRYSQRKEAAWEIIEDLENLKENGVIFRSATTDGARGIIRAISLFYPDIPHQRCLVHLQRLGLAFLTQKPKTQPGWELRNLVSRLNEIDTDDKSCYWKRDLYQWCNKYYFFLKEKSYSFEKENWWYTHRSLRKVRRMIINALPNMWHYLNDKKIRKDTNNLEGQWSSLKGHHFQHRGLSMGRKAVYLAWYLKVVVNKEKPTRNVH